MFCSEALVPQPINNIDSLTGAGLTTHSVCRTCQFEPHGRFWNDFIPGRIGAVQIILNFIIYIFLLGVFLPFTLSTNLSVSHQFRPRIFGRKLNVGVSASSVGGCKNTEQKLYIVISSDNCSNVLREILGVHASEGQAKGDEFSIILTFCSHTLYKELMCNISCT